MDQDTGQGNVLLNGFLPQKQKHPDVLSCPDTGLVHDINQWLVYEIQKLQATLQEKERLIDQVRFEWEQKLNKTREQHSALHEKLNDQVWSLEVEGQQMQGQLQASNQTLKHTLVNHEKTERRLRDMLEQAEEARVQHEKSLALAKQRQCCMAKELRGLKKENSQLQKQLDMALAELNICKSKVAVLSRASASDTLEGMKVMDALEEEGATEHLSTPPPWDTSNVKPWPMHTQRLVHSLRISLHRERLEKLESRHQLAETQKRLEQLTKEYKHLQAQMRRKPSAVKKARRGVARRPRGLVPNMDHSEIDECLPPQMDEETVQPKESLSLFNELSHAVASSTYRVHAATQTEAVFAIDQATQCQPMPLMQPEHTHQATHILPPAPPPHQSLSTPLKSKGVFFVSKFATYAAKRYSRGRSATHPKAVAHHTHGALKAVETDTLLDWKPTLASVQEPAHDAAVVGSVTHTMIGEWMYKHTRRYVGGGISEHRHRRYVWIHPYTRTLYWSTTQPGAGSGESMAKRARIQDAWSVRNEHGTGPSCSILIRTTNRDLKLTALKAESHDQWLKSLAFLVRRPHGSVSETLATKAVHPTDADVRSDESLLINDSALLSQCLSLDDLDSDDDPEDFINIRQCCNGMHDVSTLTRD